MGQQDRKVTDLPQVKIESKSSSNLDGVKKAIEYTISSYIGRPIIPGLIEEFRRVLDNILNSAYINNILKEELRCVILQPINYNIEILFIDKEGKIVEDLDKYEYTRAKTEESK